jgi:hypothetical protein
LLIDRVVRLEIIAGKSLAELLLGTANQPAGVASLGSADT